MSLKLNEIKDMSVGELTDQLTKSNLELTTLRMKLAARQLDDVSLIRKTRKEIARILTVLTGKLKEGSVTKVEVVTKQEKKIKKVVEEVEEKKEKSKKKVTKGRAKEKSKGKKRCLKKY